MTVQVSVPMKPFALMMPPVMVQAPVTVEATASGELEVPSIVTDVPPYRIGPATINLIC